QAPPPLPTLPGLGPIRQAAGSSPSGAAPGEGARPDVDPAGAAPGAPGPWLPPAIGAPAAPAAQPAPGSRALWVGLGLLAMVGLAVLAASTTVWVLVLPVVGLLGWAWSQGRATSP